MSKISDERRRQLDDGEIDFDDLTDDERRALEEQHRGRPGKMIGEGSDWKRT